jgi:Family of unknown function (DUF6404)
MRHDQKLAYFEQMLRDRGDCVADGLPPAWRLLWKLGGKMPPPYFLPLPIGILAAGLPFGLSLGLIMSLVSRFSPDLVGSRIWLTAIISGSFFGVFMAWFWRSRSRKLQLPDWKRFPGTDR